MIAFVHVYFSGHVQGVGFRYATVRVARDFEVAGYVRNLPDGRVELEAEGDAATLDAFVEAVREQMDGYIKSVEKTQGRREAELSGFTIGRI